MPYLSFDLDKQRPFSGISSKRNRVSITGILGIDNYIDLLMAIYETIGKENQDIELDFSQCSAAFAGPMLAVCAQMVHLRSKGTQFRLILPEKDNLQRLFRNTNWANIIDPDHYEQSSFKGYTQVPARHFISATDQHKAVNTIMDAMLRSLRGFTRGDLAAIEWSINEITDNVINHSESQTGGFVQLTTFSKQQRRVEYAVCDAGIGIPSSLRQSHPELTSDTDALDRAIREGVTRDKKIGQGNGLFGSFEISRVSEGYFEVHSGHARLRQNKKVAVRVREAQVPYQGTLVVSCMDYSKPGILEQALRFGDKPYKPVDYIETEYESTDGKRIVFLMKEESQSFGSRVAGRPVKIKLQSLATLCPEQKIFVDFSDIPVISSSFADEILGKLFVELGPLAFMQRFEIVNTTETVKSLIDRAIAQRAKEGI